MAPFSVFFSPQGFFGVYPASRMPVRGIGFFLKTMMLSPGE